MPVPKSAKLLGDEMDEIRGLKPVVAHLSHSNQQLALQWCRQEDADSVLAIVAAGQAEAFIQALGLKQGGCNETALRTRLNELTAV